MVIVFLIIFYWVNLLMRERERESNNLFVFFDMISKEGSIFDVFESLFNYSDVEMIKFWYYYYNMIDIFKWFYYEIFWLEK